MLGKNYEFDLYRKYLIYFGTLFNDIHLVRKDAQGNNTHLIKVPISYAPKDKLLARISADPAIERKAAVVLPRMAFQSVGFSYDGSRALPTLNRNVVKHTTDADKLKYQYVPVPININWELYIYVKNAFDGTKIMEQIIPFFKPEFTSTIELIPEMNVNMDIPLAMGNMSYEDTYDGQFVARRAIIWTIPFTMKAFFYGPVYEKPIIKFANTNFVVASREEDINAGSLLESIQVKPGLTANGEPTANASLSIDTGLIEVDDDFGYILTESGFIATSNT